MFTCMKPKDEDEDNDNKEIKKVDDSEGKDHDVSDGGFCR